MTLARTTLSLILTSCPSKAINFQLSPNPPNEGDTATGWRGWGERARLSGLHPEPVGRSGAARSRRAGRDGGTGRSQGHSRTGPAASLRGRWVGGWRVVPW